MNTSDIILFLKTEISKVLDKQPEDIDEGSNFLGLGISSIQTLGIINRIQKKLEIDINPIAMFEYRTIALFADYLMDCLQEQGRLS